jgi:hypothetical protein
MNKFVVIIVVVVVAAFALGAAGYVYAQSPTPQAPVPGTGYGMMGASSGRMGARGGMMAGSTSVSGDQDGLLHDGMIAVYSQKLGISVDDLNARLIKGETMAQIAYSKGLTAAEFSTLMTDARSQAIDQAVKDGTLTQAQVDWMKQRGAGMMAGVTGRMGGGGMMGGGRGMGMRGAAQGQFANPDCPYNSQTQQ